MSKIKVAEIFHSLQGEGMHVGISSVFLRTFGCNFECRGFGMPWARNEEHDRVYQSTTEPEEFADELKKNPDWKYTDLPLAKTGCDSYASWHKGFKKLSPTMTVDEVVREVEMTRTVDSGWIDNTGQTHLVVTGGEPLLGWQRSYPELLEKLYAKGYKEVTFETNGTQKIHDEFADFMFRSQIAGGGPNYTFSVSPKLAGSGEDIMDALQPEIVASYMRYGTVYLKFVISDMGDLPEIDEFVAAYTRCGWEGEVYVMPCGGDPELYNANAPDVAKAAMLQGWRYSPRLQVDIWKNEWGT